MSKKNSSYYVTDIDEYVIINEAEYKAQFNSIQRNYVDVKISGRHEIVDDILYIPCSGGGHIIFQVVGRKADKIILEFICTKGRGGI